MFNFNAKFLENIKKKKYNFTLNNKCTSLRRFTIQTEMITLVNFSITNLGEL